ncbi:MAG: exo-alpha-sialidase [Acidobacteria bacterium]|nr:exo-alpha-sialidase [Acidobacteriota bacterium]MCA1608610.1 exo-alpha-sialidase [Acidobacteriota bacterium]
MPQDNLLLMIGTAKGLFLLHGGGNGKWKLDGPRFGGRAVYSAMYDQRKGREDMWAAATSWHFGAELSKSTDMGKTWDAPERMRIKMPKVSKQSLENIWQIAAGGNGDSLYVGVAPAALFESHDRGETWQMNRGLWNHPHRKKWTPGFGGLCLHTIVTDKKDPKNIKIAISTGGVYQTSDGGENWKVTNTGVKAYFLPDQFPEFGQCVHKIARHPKKKNTFFLQNHHGVYRSRDGAETWTEIENGLPSNFGFGLTVSDSGSVFIVPLDSDGKRFTCEGRLRVYRSRDDGDSWQPLAKGLPQKNAYEVILRDGVASTGDNIFLGTKNGKLFGSMDDGDSWKLIEGSLPEICCVKAYSI